MKSLLWGVSHQVPPLWWWALYYLTHGTHPSIGFNGFLKHRQNPHLSPVYYSLSHFLTLLLGFWYVQERLRARSVIFGRRKIPAKMFLHRNIVTCEKKVLFGKNFTCMKWFFSHDNASQIQMHLWPSILSRLRDCVTAHVTCKSLLWCNFPHVQPYCDKPPEKEMSIWLL